MHKKIERSLVIICLVDGMKHKAVADNLSQRGFFNGFSMVQKGLAKNK